jgi:hypothetical protein
MKKLILIGSIAGGLWWYFIGGRTLTEDKVRDFYQKQEVALLNRNPEELCKLLDNDFQGTGTTSSRGESQTSTSNKEQACKSAEDLFKTFEMMGNKMGGIVQLDHQYTIQSIEIAADKKSAIVKTNDILNVGDSMMNISSNGTDTIISKNGKPLLLKSEGTTEISGGR